MKRKVLKVGNASLAVSLPSQWVKYTGLKQGDELEVVEREGMLQIGAFTTATGKEITVEMPEASEFAKRLIFSPYIQGFDLIRAKFPSIETKKKIEESTNFLMGCDIVDQQPDRVIIKTIAEGKMEEFNSIFFRKMHLVREIAAEILAGIQERNRKRLYGALGYDQMVNKFDIFCRRMLNTSVKLPTPQITSLYRINCGLEEIGDQYNELIQELIARESFPKELTEEIPRLIELHDTFFSLYTKPTTKKLAQFKHKCIDVKKNLKGCIDSGGVLSFPYMKLYEIAEKYRAITEELLFPFKEHQEKLL